jgi:hypothetical protein
MLEAVCSVKNKLQEKEYTWCLCPVTYWGMHCYNLLVLSFKTYKQKLCERGKSCAQKHTLVFQFSYIFHEGVMLFVFTRKKTDKRLNFKIFSTLCDNLGSKVNMSSVFRRC